MTTTTATASKLIPPLGSDAAWAAGWTPAEARLAVDQHKRGTFRWSWQLSIDCTSYPPIKCALDQRLASPCGLPWTVDGADRAPGRIERDAARTTWRDHLRRLVRSTLRDLAMEGFSVWHHPLVVDPDTLRAEIAPFAIQPPESGGYQVGIGGVQRWPISAVGYTAYPMLGVIGYYAIAMGGQRIQLPRPGESSDEWTVVGEGDQPHLDGSIVAVDMEFTGGMLTRRARANLGQTAGRASAIGYMPDKVPVSTADAEGRPVNGPGEQAQATLAALGTEQTTALFPFGFKVDKFELLMTGAAEYFQTDLRDSILMVALAVMGRGGALAKTDAQYQGPTEMDVPESLVRRDVGALERAASGLFAMLAKKNAGERVEAPRLCGHLPDADQVARRKAEDDETKAAGERLTAFHGAIHAERDNGFEFKGEVGQARINELAAFYRVPAPILPPEGLPPVLVRLPPSSVPITGEAAAQPPAPPPGAPDPVKTSGDASAPAGPVPPP